ncbi:MAG: D-gamma-glutamyl-meso-diaminopimelic acid endopeptidase CwlS [Verrucomicrobia subdivision 3 bacterium]|nr:D-gamma-glutamyl-meso-diaminopimelic acid endopeptidase CwlS [Limisphaerales bacterium]MCS1412385.1 D-gamma-glutamyl-meso-diaminopimelic acid endopeptidase CwlS [Limisphaerales bacterium]
MSHSNPVLPPGSSLNDRKHRKTKIIITVCGIVALHVLPISGLLLMQGCKSEQEQMANETVNTPNDEIPLLNINDLYQEIETTETGTSLPITGGAPDIPKPNQNLEPMISTELILEEPDPTPVNGLGEVAAHMPGMPTQLPTTQESPTTSSPPSLDYKIKPGDRLYSLAREYSSTVDAILGANPGVDPRRLRVGQSIMIPRNANSPQPPPSGGVRGGHASDGKIYLVKWGDTLTRIARQNGISLRALRKENALNTDRILVGQKLKIPVAEGASAKAE